MNVLYISYDGMTDPLGQSQVIPYLEGLSKQGYDITILSCEKPSNYKEKAKIIEEQLVNGGIKWRPIFYTKYPPVISTLYDVFKLKKEALGLLRNEKFGIIHCRSYIAALIGLKLKRSTHVKFVFDMRGFWADERVDGKIWNLRNPLYKFIYKYFKSKEIEFINEADYVISLTENGKREILSWTNINKDETLIQVIPCCVDIALFSWDNIKQEDRLFFKKKFNINENDFVLTYLGAIGTWYMLEEMLDFFKMLYLKHPSSKFLFITQEDPEMIFSSAEKKHLKRELFVIYKADRKEVPVLLSLSSASIFFIKPAYSKKASSPTKQGELMSMGIPVVCNKAIGDTDYVIEKYDSGILVENFEDESYMTIVNGVEKLQNMDKETIRAGAIDFFSLKKGVDLYAKVYREVLA